LLPSTTGLPSQQAGAAAPTTAQHFLFEPSPLLITTPHRRQPLAKTCYCASAQTLPPRFQSLPSPHLDPPGVRQISCCSRPRRPPASRCPTCVAQDAVVRESRHDPGLWSRGTPTTLSQPKAGARDNAL
jgi:hypothetical protein